MKAVAFAVGLLAVATIADITAVASGAATTYNSISVVISFQVARLEEVCSTLANKFKTFADL